MLGVIGGTGLYNLPDLADVNEVTVDTAWGHPSSAIVIGRLGSSEVAFLARHGRDHQYNPSEVNYRANIAALKSIGVTHILSVNAVGSLNIAMPPRAAVVPDQIIDRTAGFRARTFFDRGAVGHVGLADPFCNTMRRAILAHARANHDLVEEGGTYICIEGPQFSPRAESNLYRQWGADIIGMTAMPEARLAREAGLCYGTLAMVTDFDVWHETEEDVTIEAVQRVLAENVETARNVVRGLATEPKTPCDCCAGASNAVMTHSLAPEIAARLDLILRAPGKVS